MRIGGKRTAATNRSSQRGDCGKGHRTWRNPAEHKAGTNTAWVVKRYGLRLLPELYGHLKPMPYEAAAQMEKDFAEDLRRAGYTVTGGH